MKTTLWLSLIASLAVLSCSSVRPSLDVAADADIDEPPPWFDPRIDSLVSSELRRFRGAAQFEQYRKHLHELAVRYDASWARALPSAATELVAALDSAGAQLVCDGPIEECGSALEEVAVTGSRIVAPSITNNQEAGVDEGDIVKQLGRFLVVLHDGRLFSIDMGESPGTMSFVDRINVYPNADRGTWYDELLITDNRLVVVGYDYDEEASELAIFKLDDNGVFTFEATYYITSNDYYSSDNYASRLVDGNLVLYTPLYLVESDPEEPQEFPQVRRWTEIDGYSEWQPLFTPYDIYFPIQRTLEPTVHTISVCPIAGEFQCRSTGVIGPSQREFYVTPEFAYVWVSTSSTDSWEWSLDDCDEDVASGPFRPLPAALYRIPLAGGRAHAVRTSGAPPDQFSLDAREDEFLALLYFEPGECYSDEEFALRYARIDAELFSSRPPTLPLDSYWSMPKPSGDGIENRFTEGYLVYGGSQGRWAAYGDRYEYDPTELVVVPVDDPAATRALPLLHSAERIEAFGQNVVVDGYRGNEGLSISTIDLVHAPAVADVEYLPSVLESEGRSHAFNSRLDADGGGVFGLPTIFKHETWRDFSNVHFFAVEPSLDIRPSGYLRADEDAIDEDYECEVSCVDWYGNSRPIFAEGRVFGLMGTELVEGRLFNGGIAEIQRVGITGLPRYRR